VVIRQLFGGKLAVKGAPAAHPAAPQPAE
jgi:hypothetical protein